MLYDGKRVARCKSRSRIKGQCTKPANHTGYHTCLAPTGGWTGVKFRRPKKAAQAKGKVQ